LLRISDQQNQLILGLLDGKAREQLSIPLLRLKHLAHFSLTST